MADTVPLPVELYGKLADPCGPAITIPIPAAGCTATQLRALVAAHHAGLAALLATTRVRLCINDGVAAESVRVKPGDTVALMPPVSGG
ncbi:MAG TPA: MoaD/ThiS family protein [Novosphingobium sp.]